MDTNTPMFIINLFIITWFWKLCVQHQMIKNDIQNGKGPWDISSELYNKPAKVGREKGSPYNDGGLIKHSLVMGPSKLDYKNMETHK